MPDGCVQVDDGGLVEVQDVDAVFMSGRDDIVSYHPNGITVSKREGARDPVRIRIGALWAIIPQLTNWWNLGKPYRRALACIFWCTVCSQILFVEGQMECIPCGRYASCWFVREDVARGVPWWCMVDACYGRRTRAMFFRGAICVSSPNSDDRE